MVKYDLNLIAKVTEVKLEVKLANFRQKYQYTIKYCSLENTYIINKDSKIINVASEEETTYKMQYEDLNNRYPPRYEKYEKWSIANYQNKIKTSKCDNNS